MGRPMRACSRGSSAAHVALEARSGPTKSGHCPATHCSSSSNLLAIRAVSALSKKPAVSPLVAPPAGLLAAAAAGGGGGGAYLASRAAEAAGERAGGAVPARALPPVPQPLVWPRPETWAEKGRAADGERPSGGSSMISSSVPDPMSASSAAAAAAAAAAALERRLLPEPGRLLRRLLPEPGRAPAAAGAAAASSSSLESRSDESETSAADLLCARVTSSAPPAVPPPGAVSPATSARSCSSTGGKAPCSSSCLHAPTLPRHIASSRSQSRCCRALELAWNIARMAPSAAWHASRAASEGGVGVLMAAAASGRSAARRSETASSVSAAAVKTGSREAGGPAPGCLGAGVLRKSASASKSGVASAVKRASSLASFIWNGRVHSEIITAAAGPRSPDSPPRRSSRAATCVSSWASGASSCRKKPSGRRRHSLRSSPTCRTVSSARCRCSKHLRQLPVISSCTGSAASAWFAILSSERGCTDDDASALATAMI